MKLIKLFPFYLTMTFLLSIVSSSVVMANSLCEKELDEKQKVFLLSLLSNSVSGVIGSQDYLEKLAQERINRVLNDPAIQKCTGKWEVVWGPAVYVHDHSIGADHQMFVARNGKQDVVAIAGSNPVSWYNWLVENIDVFHQSKWPYGNPPDDAKLANGTTKGLDILLKMTSPFGPSGTLLEFLNKKEAEQIIFTGHSLGGALSPTLGLAIFDQAELNISTYPSAGPTAGSKGFSTYYDSRLGSATDRIWNKYDMVPYAWNAATLREIPSLFEPELKLEFGWKLALVAAVEGIIIGLNTHGVNNYLHILPNAPSLPDAKVDYPIPSVCPKLQLQLATRYEQHSSQAGSLLEKALSEDAELAGKFDKMLQSSNDHDALFMKLPQGEERSFMKLPPGDRVDLVKAAIINLTQFLEQVGYQHVDKYFTLMGVTEIACYAQQLIETPINRRLNPSEVADIAVKLISKIE